MIVFLILRKRLTTSAGFMFTFPLVSPLSQFYFPLYLPFLRLDRPLLTFSSLVLSRSPFFLSLETLVKGSCLYLSTSFLDCKHKCMILILSWTKWNVNTYLHWNLCNLKWLFCWLFPLLHFIKFPSYLHSCILLNAILKLSLKVIWEFETLIQSYVRKYMYALTYKLGMVFIESLKAACGSYRFTA